jgi:hypothetical protein
VEPGIDLANFQQSRIIQDIRERSARCIVRGALMLTIAAGAILLFPSFSGAQTLTKTALAASSSAPSEPTIIIGFVGGRVHSNDPYHAEVQLADQLQKEYSKGIEVQVFENKREEDAHQLILRTLDTNHDGELSAQEKQRARIILYGHSWGACAVIMLAQQLERDRVPVLLTVQIDSVARHGHEDNVVPANVERAVNFYQPHGMIHGLPEITAADPARTQILGNYRFDYDTQPVACVGYPWYAHIVFRAHTEIECDPRVWSQIASLIRKEISPSPDNLSATTAPSQGAH